jgi:hypothetical protein
MRLSSNMLDVDARLESTTFSKWLLAIGEGVTPTTVKGKRKEHG